MENEQKIVSSVWPEWTLEHLIGEGSYGRVYKAKKVEKGEEIFSAVKILRIPQSMSEYTRMKRDGMSDDEVRDYFESFIKDIKNEIEMMATLKGSENVVDYEDHCIVRNDEGTSWTILIRMELLVSLSDYISKHQMDNQDVVWIGIEICKALEMCRKHNIIHRDIKPDNIFVGKNGSVKLGDFGIARQLEKTTSGLSKKGTYTYMAPEVYKGEAYGESVDIYSLGIVLYKLLNNNRLPFSPPPPEKITYQNKEAALMRRMSGEEPEPPCNADERVAQVILKACSYDPKARYSTAAEMTADLRRTVKPTPPVTDEQKKKNLFDKIRALPKALRVLLATVAVIAAFFVTMFFLKPSGIGGNVTVPKVEGCVLEQAGDILQRKMLDYEVGFEMYSGTVKKGFVIEQSPAPEEKIRKDQSVVLIVSGGSIPSCIGLTQKEAQDTLEELGFTVETVYDDNELAKDGTVTVQKPVNGDRVTQDKIVMLTVCKKEEDTKAPSTTKKSLLYVVPNVTGKTLDAAQKAVEDRMLSVSVKYGYSTQSIGTVISQSPVGGTAGKDGDTVVLTVSKGQQIEMPDFLGSARVNAVSRLESLGFKVTVSTKNTSDIKSNDLVLEQSILPGSIVDQGTVVRLTVGKYTEQSTSVDATPSSQPSSVPPSSTVSNELQTMKCVVRASAGTTVKVSDGERMYIYTSNITYDSGAPLTITYYNKNLSYAGYYEDGMKVYSLVPETVVPR